MYLAAIPVLANAPGNNGTVKIHEGATEEEPLVANDPHVCTFHLHFFFGDDVQSGDWWIEEWAPGEEKGTVVLSGTYDAAGGEDRDPDSGTHSLPDGHYKLFWEGAENPGGQLNIKHKVFWVDCEPGGGEEGNADVTVSKSASVSSIDAGGSFSYTLIVANSGTATATNVTVTDNTLDLPLIFSAPTASQGTCAIDGANNLSCSLGDIEAGAEVTITFAAEATEDACPRAINRATVAADNDSDTSNNVSNAVTVRVNCEQEPETDGAALNIRKVDDQGTRLAGAVFTVEGMEGTFTTGENGHFCITGLEEDSVWLVTEIQAPAGYEIADEASQLVEVDNDGDCRSPDAVFVNTLADEEENAALKIRKVDEEGNRLPGAVFEIEGMEGTFTTDAAGEFCVTGLDLDTWWTVTEVQAPAGYEIAEEASQLVEADDDGDCNSPDAVFVNTLAEEEPNEEEPNTQPTPRENELGGNPTPTPGQGGTLPDTAVASTGAPIPPAVGALVALASLLVLAGAQLAEARARR